MDGRRYVCMYVPAILHIKNIIYIHVHTHGDK